MPRQRQRIVYCDCFDCRDRHEEPSLTAEQLDAATAVARQEPPPKALLIYASGFILADDGSTTLDSCTLPHCNLLVREGNLGLLATRKAQEAPGLQAGFSEVSQLLGVYQEICRQPTQGVAAADAQPEAGLPNLAARFKGMQAVLASTSAPVRHLAGRLGVAVSERLSIGDGSEAQGSAVGTEPAAAEGQAASAPAGPGPGSAAGGGPGEGEGKGRRGLLGLLPDASAFAGTVASELGASEGASGRDLLLLHLGLDDLLVRAGAGAGAGAAEAAGPTAAGGNSEEAAGGGAEADARWDAACEGLEWLDALVKGLLALPEIRERTLLVLMLSPAGHKMPAMPGQAGGASLLQHGGAQLDPAAAIITPRSAAQVGRGAAGAAAAAGVGPGMSVLDAEELPLVTRPVQSFELLGMGRVEADLDAPVVVTRRLPGVVRRDRADRLSYKEALSAGGQGAILLDRLLPEVAYKVGRAPKYGA